METIVQGMGETVRYSMTNIPRESMLDVNLGFICESTVAVAEIHGRTLHSIEDGVWFDVGTADVVMFEPFGPV